MKDVGQQLLYGEISVLRNISWIFRNFTLTGILIIRAISFSLSKFHDTSCNQTLLTEYILPKLKSRQPQFLGSSEIVIPFCQC